MAGKTVSTAHSASARVPSRAAWPPPWLAERPGRPADVLSPSTTKPPDAAATPSPAKSTKPTAKERSVGEWPLELSSLVEWFLSSRDQLPREPYQLRPGIHVIRPHRFYGALERDIAAGPHGVRARSGLMSDLVDLLSLVEGARRHIPAPAGRRLQRTPSASRSDTYPTSTWNDGREPVISLLSTPGCGWNGDFATVPLNMTLPLKP